MKTLALSAILVASIIGLVAAPKGGDAKASYPPHFEGAEEVIYKKAGEAELKLWVFNPKDHKVSNATPAIVFFFGGGWSSGTPAQFERHCRYLASRGMVAMTADYRVASRQRAKASDCVEDAKSAIRYVRAHATKLGVDPKRIAAGGGSAGGHLAGAAAALPGLNAKGDDMAVSCVPDALVLFNPALVLAPLDGEDFGGFGTNVTSERLGADKVALSPAHHVKAGMPPTIIFHGKADTTVPFATAAAFKRTMEKAGNRCELVEFEGQGHGFFNFGRGDGKAFGETVAAMDKFLVSLGWLNGESTVETFFSK